MRRRGAPAVPGASGSTRAAVATLLFAALLFSTGGAAIKSSSLSAWQIAGWRSAIAGLFLFCVAREARRLRGVTVWVVGAFFAATMLLFVLANRLTTAANTVFLQSTAPLYALVFGFVVLRERPRREDAWTFLALGGALALFLAEPGESHTSAPDPALGNVLAACAGVTWGATLTGLRRLATSNRPTLAAVVAGNTLAAVIAFTVLASSEASVGFPLRGGRELAIVAWLGVFQIGLAYVLVGRGLRSTPVFLASLLLLAEPVANPFFAWLVHGEVPHRNTILGGLLVLAACGERAWRQRAAGRGPGPQST